MVRNLACPALVSGIQHVHFGPDISFLKIVFLVISCNNVSPRDQSSVGRQRRLFHSVRITQKGFRSSPSPDSPRFGQKKDLRAREKDYGTRICNGVRPQQAAGAHAPPPRLPFDRSPRQRPLATVCGTFEFPVFFHRFGPFLPSKQGSRSSCSVTLGVKNDCGERYIKSFQCDFPKLFREQHREQREDASQKYMRNALYGRKGGAFQPW